MAQVQTRFCMQRQAAGLSQQTVSHVEHWPSPPTKAFASSTPALKVSHVPSGWHPAMFALAPAASW